MRYRDRGFFERFNDPNWAEAERIFCEVWEEKYEKRGNDKTEIDIRRWSNFLKYMPDFLDRHGWIECKGFGRDRVLKIKDDTREALNLWKKFDNVRMFIWDKHRQRWTVLDWQVVDRKLRLPHETGVFDGKKPYRGLHFDQLETLAPVWHDHVPQERSPTC